MNLKLETKVDKLAMFFLLNWNSLISELEMPLESDLLQTMKLQAKRKYWT